MNLNCTLLGDGSSDKMLIPVLKWLMYQHFPDTAINIELADLRPLLPSKKVSLEKKICLAIDLFPCDLLFIHRDVEKKTYEKRHSEINKATMNVACDLPVNIPVIPCRMSEAWLLIDEEAIRFAAGNPKGKVKLDLPKLRKLEELPDPKRDLIQLIKTATELNKRRLKHFKPHSAIHRVADNIKDYSPLRELPAFSALENLIQKLDFSSKRNQYS